ncbi:diguanylate cyclase [Amorphus sp. 3PC139-8]|uniref:GGDEF domain-containing protein n=1 Tax=Amorphus sp. 3PC139-8 TaxID=2735676 RepID=UPI00345D91DB
MSLNEKEVLSVRDAGHTRMLLEYGTIMMMAGVCSAALCISAIVSWAADRHHTFMIIWSGATLTYVAATMAFGQYAQSAAPTTGWIASITLILGSVLAWMAAADFENGQAPAVGGFGRLIPAVVLITALALVGRNGLMLALTNLITCAVLAETATIYYCARRESPAYLIGLAGFYGVAAASFAICGISLLVFYPVDFLGVPDSWAETANGILSVLCLTGIGALSLALVHQRAANRHRVDAMTDSLTGLLNRRALIELGRTNGLSLCGASAIVFDLDNFKVVNDTHGHAIGDMVLKRFAMVCRQGLRATDLAARIGGEEFAVVLPGTDATSAHLVADRIRDRFEREHIVTPRAMVHGCTVSAGVFASPPATCYQIQDLISHADAALYEAKQSGRNRVCILPIPAEIN